MYSEEKWMRLNPEGFKYAGSTFELPEELLSREYDEWFVDLYSKTFPREDRARIMEYAMIGMDAMFVAAPYRQEKLKYLKMIHMYVQLMQRSVLGLKRCLQMRIELQRQ
jgi:hypothetical protein